SESVQHVEEGEDTLNPYINVYNETFNEEAVLVRAKFNQNNNSKFLPGQIELTFKDVTSNIELNAHNLHRPLTEIELQKKAQLVDQVFNKNIVYNDYWDNYIKNISTGREADKIFLSGNLLRGMAFQNIVGVTGKIVKYNSFDKKLLTSLELDTESTKRLMPRFNEKVNFSLLAGLNEDNLKNLIIPCIISQMGFMGPYAARRISSQIYLDTAPTFLECYFTGKAANELGDIVYNEWSKQTNELSDTNDWFDVDENGKSPKDYYLEKFNKEFTRPLVMENIQKLRFNITSVSRGVIKFLEAIAMSMGAEAPVHNGNISEIAWLESDMYNSGKYASTIQYSAKGDFKKDTKKQEPFLNEVYNSRSRKFDYRLSSDNQLLNGIYISSASIISDRASSSGKEYFIGTYNLVMTYDTLVAVINYLEKAKNTQILATTSNDVLLMAEPPYVFSQTSSAMGIIDQEEGVEIVDNVGEMTIVSIENIINDFVNIYNN
ncbi:MAG: hypothetical protein ORN50_05865, partial [Crocinitomicaceae bacterium]|nr:hypothetical protein [Crocinitomicaceae bacterium]